MRKVTVLLIFIATLSFAQSESRIGWIAKFGGAGGVTPFVLFPNFDELNISMAGANLDDFSGPIIAFGGGGYAYVMIIDNLRLGGVGFVGSQSTSSKLNGFNNEVIYSIGGGAATIEYTMPFIKNIAVSAGVMIGAGGIDIEVYQNSTEYDWNSLWYSVPPSPGIQNTNYKISNSFFLFSPTVNVDIPITRFLAIRGGLGYQFAIGDSWEINNGQELKSVPSGLNGNSFFIQTGIFIGLFAF